MLLKEIQTLPARVRSILTNMGGILLHENTPDFCRTFPLTRHSSTRLAQPDGSKLDTVDIQDTIPSTHFPCLLKYEPLQTSTLQ